MRLRNDRRHFGDVIGGVIDQRGKFVRDVKTDRIREGDEGPEFVFCRGEKDVVLTEVDIENVLRGKGCNLCRHISPH